MMNTLLALTVLAFPVATTDGVLEDPPVVEDPVVEDEIIEDEILEEEILEEAIVEEEILEEEVLEEKAAIDPLARIPAVAIKTTVFKAKKVFLGDGRVLEDGVVVVKDGVIAQVGKGLEVPFGAGLVEHDGVIAPGMIALHAYDGAGGELEDSTRELLPEAEARFAFHPESADFKRLVGAGITSVVLAPTPANLIGGQSAVVKTSGGEVVKAGGQLAIGLSGQALNGNRFPTSYDGAMRELDRVFSDPKGPVARAVSGNLPVLIAVDDRAETLRACGFASRYSLKGALYGSIWAEDVVGTIKDSGLSVVCDPFDVGDNSRGVRGVNALAKAGVRFGFGLDTPGRSPHCLRFGAALCVRGGLDRAAARRALTGDAAEIAGVAARVGRINRGLDADLVLWSGDPVDLTSSIDSVYIDGERVVGGEK